MDFHQDPTNTSAKRCSSAEMSKWYDNMVEPEYLKPTHPEIIDLVATELTQRVLQLEPLPESENIS